MPGQKGSPRTALACYIYSILIKDSGLTVEDAIFDPKKRHKIKAPQWIYNKIWESRDLVLIVFTCPRNCKKYLCKIRFKSTSSA